MRTRSNRAGKKGEWLATAADTSVSSSVPVGVLVPEGSDEVAAVDCESEEGRAASTSQDPISATLSLQSLMSISDECDGGASWM
eukprot:7905932-Pyramimonas_sp.AAC.1